MDENKPEPKSRGWVDDALDVIAAAQAKGISLEELPHDVRHTVARMAERPEGERALGDKAHELDHVRKAAAFVKGRMAQIVAGLG